MTGYGDNTRSSSMEANGAAGGAAQDDKRSTKAHPMFHGNYDIDPYRDNGGYATRAALYIYIQRTAVCGIQIRA